MKLFNLLILVKVTIYRLKIRNAPIILKSALFLFLICSCTPTYNQNSSGLNQTTVEFATSEVQPDIKISPQTQELQKSIKCPGLDSQLNQLIQANDPSGTAEALGFKLSGDKIQVLITLTDENTSFLADFDAEVGTQSGTQVQAYVPIDQLCQLANKDTVLAIRPAAQAIR